MEEKEEEGYVNMKRTSDSYHKHTHLVGHSKEASGSSTKCNSVQHPDDMRPSYGQRV
jgi:hypothetical protein